jgi:bis(5'-nucleosyl)-tetraphosphatase (symmetrical)
MPTYVLGDIHGCYETLAALLHEIRFDAERDRLCLVGDLINRGPSSLAVLRWASRLGPHHVTVLGNHDVNLLAVAAGVATLRPQDNFGDVLAAPDAERLLTWLGNRPLLHREGSWAVVHAGLLPAWSLEQAESLARRVERSLQGPQGAALLAAVKRGPGAAWSDDLPEAEQDRLALGAFLHLRTLDESGCPQPWSGPPTGAPAGCRPWFGLPHRRAPGTRVFFGHWAALGLHREEGTIGLDSGCAWGGPLSAWRIDDGTLFQTAHRDGMKPR